MTSQADKAARFRALHEGAGAFVIANAWDAGSAMSGLLDAAREVKDAGTFGYLDRSLATPDLNAFMQG